MGVLKYFYIVTESLKHTITTLKLFIFMNDMSELQKGSIQQIV